MRLLVLGGGWFLGRAVAQDALRRGYEVTLFNRGRSGTVPDGVRIVKGDRCSSNDLHRLAASGDWDAVVDTSASEMPAQAVRDSANALKQVVRRYVFMSTVNAYTGWPTEPLSEHSPVYEPSPGTEIGDYGRQKAEAERAVLSAFGPDRTVLLRPGVILGPGEYVGRLPWWLRRASRGGTILAPGRPEQPIQPIDVRDAAAFALDRASSGAGPYNLVAPSTAATMEDLLTWCLEATGSQGGLRWVPDDVLSRHGVREWTELPLWRTTPGAWSVDASRAWNEGLSCRPLRGTVMDTWSWLNTGGVPVPHPRAADHGITQAREAEILADL